MAWQKIPAANQAPFLQALPQDRRSRTQKMFGGICAMANGNMYAGLWADTAMVRLGDPEREKVLAMPGSGPFDPMGKGRPTRDMVLLPVAVFQHPAALKRWLAAALAYAVELPPKKKKAAAKKR